MSSYENIFATYESVDKEAIPGFIVAKLDTLKNASREYPEILPVIKDFLFGTIFADGVLAKNELNIVTDLCKRYRGDFPAEQVKEGLLKGSEKLDPMEHIGAFNKLPEFLRDDIVLICLIISDIDGNIDDTEIEFLKKIAN